MKDIKQIQEYNRRKIITSQFPEYKNFCKLVEEDCAGYEDCEKWIRIEEKPLTLDRVLLALEKTDFEERIYIDSRGWLYKKRIDKDYKATSISCGEWNLTKPTLKEQSKETQIAIAKLLGYKEE